MNEHSTNNKFPYHMKKQPVKKISAACQAANEALYFQLT